MEDFQKKDTYTVDDFRKIIRLLRSENGCPWDREQTHESIRRNLLEEAYEACEAIDENDPIHLREELGDVLMQVIFHSQIAEEQGNFHLDDVADAACKKLIYRHPHVFSDTQVQDSTQVLDNWDALKRKERAQSTVTSTLHSVSRALPALWRAEKIQKKAAKEGYLRSNTDGHIAEIGAETNKLTQAITEGGNAEAALGSLLFAVVNAARCLKIDPESALNSACEAFIHEFEDMETSAAKHREQ